MPAPSLPRPFAAVLGLATMATPACSDHAGLPPAAETRVSRSAEGGVVSQSPIATAVGAEVLAHGGNAVDAAVATAFALAVVEPSNSGLGGRTQILIRTPGGRVAGLDATTQVPESYPVDSVPPANAGSGYGMIGVPGTVAGLTTALERYGSWALGRVMQPAIELAEHGFALSASQARAIGSVAEDLKKYDASAHYFLHSDGTPYEAGARFVQTDLAGTLRAIAVDGASAFYTGVLADRIAADMGEHGGFVAAADLAAYEVRDALVVRGNYRGYELVGTYLPAAGANTIQILEILEHFDVAALAGTSAWAALVAQAQLMGFQDRLRDLANMGPPATFPRPQNARALLSDERIAEHASHIRPLTVSGSAADRRTVAGTFPAGHTTHLSVVDDRGGAVALTQSLGPTMGSRVAAPGLGFVYAATMGYLSGEARSAGLRALGPGDRASSRQSPMMVMRDGELVAVLGGSGSRRIVSGLVQVISHLVDEGLALPEAIARPRVHVEPSQPGIVHMQVRDYGAWDEQQRADLRAFGFDVRDAHTQSFGNVSAIARDSVTGEWVAVADPGGTGAASRPKGP